MIRGSFLLLPHFLFILLLHIPLLERREYKSGFPPSPIHDYTLPVPSMVISGLSLPSLISFTSLSISFHHCPVFPPHTRKHTHPRCDLLRPNTYTHQYFFSCFSPTHFPPLVCPPKSILNPTPNLYLFWSFLPSFLVSLWRKKKKRGGMGKQKRQTDFRENIMSAGRC